MLIMGDSDDDSQGSWDRSTQKKKTGNNLEKGHNIKVSSPETTKHKSMQQKANNKPVTRRGGDTSQIKTAFRKLYKQSMTGTNATFILSVIH